MEFRPIGAALALLAAFVIALPAFSAEQGSTGSGVRIADAWVRAPAPGQKTAGAYVEVTSDRDAAIIAAGSPAAARVEMHSSTTEGGVMRMRALPRIELPAGKTVKLAPGGIHLMLIDVKQPLRVGDKVPLTLSVQPTGSAAGMSLTTLQLEAEVRAAGSAESHKH